MEDTQKLLNDCDAIINNGPEPPTNTIAKHETSVTNLNTVSHKSSDYIIMFARNYL